MEWHLWSAGRFGSQDAVQFNGLSGAETYAIDTKSIPKGCLLASVVDPSISSAWCRGSVWDRSRVSVRTQEPVAPGAPRNIQAQQWGPRRI